MNIVQTLRKARAAFAGGSSITEALEASGEVAEVIQAERILARQAGAPCLHDWLLRLVPKNESDRDLIARNLASFGVSCLDDRGRDDGVRLFTRAIQRAQKDGYR